MKARDVVGRRIVEVLQDRVGTRYSGDGTEQEWAWEVRGFVLDNGARIVLHAIETDEAPIVEADVLRPPRH